MYGASRPPPHRPPRSSTSIHSRHPYGGGGKGYYDKKRAKDAHDALKDERASKVSKIAQDYEDLFVKISPCVAAIVDSYGGCCTHAQIGQDLELSELLEKIPMNHSKQLRKVLQKVVDLYPEYIVPLAEGHFATAMAYDNGAVSPDGQLNFDKIKENMKKAEEGFWCPPRIKKLDVSQRKNKVVSAPQAVMTKGGPAQQRLDECRQHLARMAVEVDEGDFEDAIRDMKEARQQAFDGPNLQLTKEIFGNRINAMTGVHSPEGKRFYEYIRDIVHRAHSEITLLLIAKDEEARRLHNLIPPGEKRKKISKQFELCPEWFRLDRGEGQNNPNLQIVLTEAAKSTAPAVGKAPAPPTSGIIPPKEGAPAPPGAAPAKAPPKKEEKSSKHDSHRGRDRDRRRSRRR